MTTLHWVGLGLTRFHDDLISRHVYRLLHVQFCLGSCRALRQNQDFRFANLGSPTKLAT
jgi:hypothetical protein